MVNDSWTHFPSYSGAIGTSKKVTMSNVADHVSQLHALDFPRQDRIRRRVRDIVRDPATAACLQAWYPGWCKRPCFHDTYLQAFNLPNIYLVDTGGQGINRMNETGIEHAGLQYDADLIIWATGFHNSTIGRATGKADILLKGRGGIDLEQLHESGDFLTLHGVSSRDFPNMFWVSSMQAGMTVNHSFHLDNIATHVAYIMAESTSKADIGTKTIIEPTAEAQEKWTSRIVEGAPTFAAMERYDVAGVNVVNTCAD